MTTNMKGSVGPDNTRTLDELSRNNAELFNRQERMAYWLCRLIAAAQRAREALGEMSYDDERIERQLECGEPGLAKSGVEDDAP